jgi:co-chaperonin GroES (HSP10)|tara:strand:- start:924 stop:1355 length:432 start_codon:yes stop_codon:yes gene_type:complete
MSETNISTIKVNNADLEMMTTAAKDQLSDEDLELQLPKPVGYRLLVAMPEVEKTFEGTNVLKTDSVIHNEHIMSIIGVVLDMGEEAYKDKERFNNPWCKVGDYVMFRANTGTRFKVAGVEYRLMNDDSIEAVVADPRGVSRAI